MEQLDAALVISDAFTVGPQGQGLWTGGNAITTKYGSGERESEVLIFNFAPPG